MELCFVLMRLLHSRPHTYYFHIHNSKNPANIHSWLKNPAQIHTNSPQIHTAFSVQISVPVTHIHTTTSQCGHNQHWMFTGMYLGLYMSDWSDCCQYCYVRFASYLTRYVNVLYDIQMRTYSILELGSGISDEFNNQYWSGQNFVCMYQISTVVVALYDTHHTLHGHISRWSIVEVVDENQMKQHWCRVFVKFHNCWHNWIELLLWMSVECDYSCIV